MTYLHFLLHFEQSEIVKHLLKRERLKLTENNQNVNEQHITSQSKP